MVAFLPTLCLAQARPAAAVAPPPPAQDPNAVAVATRLRSYTLAELPASMCLAPGAVALAFDQGPHREWTPRYLDTLKELGVSAAFFVDPARVNDMTAPLLQRMVEEGHTIGLTFASSPPLSEVPLERVRELLVAGSAVIRRALSRPLPAAAVNTTRNDQSAPAAAASSVPPPIFIRFPKGEHTPALLRLAASLGHVPVGQSLDASDVDPADDQPLRSPDMLYVRWQQKLSPLATSRANGYVVGSHHDTSSVSLARLKDLVALARGRGYTFLPLGMCVERTADELRMLRRNAGLGASMKVAGRGFRFPTAASASASRSTISLAPLLAAALLFSLAAF